MFLKGPHGRVYIYNYIYIYGHASNLPMDHKSRVLNVRDKNVEYWECHGNSFAPGHKTGQDREIQSLYGALRVPS